MKKKGIVLMVGLSALLAMGAAGMANSWVQKRMNGGDAVSEEASVVVAAHSIPFGRQVLATDLRMMRLPPHAVPAGSFTSMDDVIGRVSSQAIYSGEVVLERRVAEHSGGSALAAMLEPGMRAISVRVDDVAGVAGFLLPGDEVDVVSSKRDGGGSRSIASDTILRRITVLAVDQNASQERDGPVIVRAVTLAVTPSQAERLFEATQEGKVALTLRNPLEKTEKQPEIVAMAETPKPMIKPAKKAEPKAVNRNRHVRVNVIRGTETSSTVVHE
ncbi:pilus assembly protein CpaB [Marinobacter daqiaonensis]|uniref:Pilus assembly protein CpaB n=1 Tax=Marinobacter daqiaonensis TaxID=650891 RepID=A0A1I6JG76_9GAMM|nr:Flp pilus assembly protein CpaB [Marinobacter daqiaonensis]SFR77972.1 pilus assembly protein CpaB [Marinobacter daqiaonensis]